MRTFIVRLAEDASECRPGGGTGRPRLRGVVDEVATGQRTTFRDDQELVTALAAALAAGPAQRSIVGEDQHVAE
ncbi:MAG TPA: hypothetical protein VF843_08050 [Streptosporangiaceae bacterium]